MPEAPTVAPVEAAKPVAPAEAPTVAAPTAEAQTVAAPTAEAQTATAATKAIDASGDVQVGLDTLAQAATEGEQKDLDADLAGTSSLVEQQGQFNPDDVDTAAATELGMNTTPKDGAPTPADAAHEGVQSTDGTALVEPRANQDPTLDHDFDLYPKNGKSSEQVIQEMLETNPRQVEAWATATDHKPPEEVTKAWREYQAQQSSKEPPTEPGTPAVETDNLQRGEATTTNPQATEGTSPTEEQPQTNEQTSTPEDLAKKQQEIKAQLDLGAKLAEHNIKGEAREKIINLIAESDEPAKMIEALNTALEQIAPGKEALNSAQTQEDQIADQITELNNKENPSPEDKKKLGFLKRLLVALKFISIGILAAGAVLTTGVVAAPSLLMGKS